VTAKEIFAGVLIATPIAFLLLIAVIL